MSLLLWKPTLYVERLQNCLPGYFFRLYNCNSLCLHRRGIPDPWPDRIWASSGHILKASCLSCARSPRAEHSTPSGVSPEQRDKITSLHLLATPLLMQSEIWLTFWATSAHDWLRIIFHAPIFPSPSQDCFPSIWLPVCVNIAGYPDPGVYFALGFSKLHEAYTYSIVKTVKVWSGWHPFPPMNQLHHSVWFYTQPCWGCTYPIYVINEDAK